MYTNTHVQTVLKIDIIFVYKMEHTEQQPLVGS